ncbi:MAG: helix-turn-helix transcriptional regulator [Elusimicrobia bacterium]|nr:helix-turn-helix transcriptional regulator [Elusimicrobiota bacterium]
MTNKKRTFRDRLNEEMKKPGFKEGFERHYLEAVVAEKIVEMREHQHMTQVQLAKAIGTGQGAISRIESGEQNLTFGMLEKIAGVLKYRVVVDFKPA